MLNGTPRAIASLSVLLAIGLLPVRSISAELLIFEAHQNSPEVQGIVDRVDRLPLGTEANPIRTSGPRGQTDYLRRLVCPSGAPAEFESTVHTVGRGPYGNLVDFYIVACPESGATNVYFDMYHPGYVEERPVPGFTLGPMQERPEARLQPSTPPWGDEPCDSTRPPAGRLFGRVVEQTDANVPGVLVRLRSETDCVEVVTDPAGRYEAELPVGRYTLETFFAGFCPRSIEGIQMRAREETEFAVGLAVAQQVDQGTQTLVRCVPSVERLELGRAFDVLDDAYVHFDTKSSSDDHVDYLSSPSPGFRVLFLRGELSFVAESILIGTDRRSLRASGGVVFGNGRSRCEEALVDLTEAVPTVICLVREP